MNSLWTEGINSVHERGIPGEGLQRGGLIALQERGHIVLLHVQVGKLEPGERVFAISPDPLNGVQLRTIGRQEDEAHVGREGELSGGMRAAVVEEQEMQAVREGCREGVGEQLKALGIQIGQFQEEALAGGGLYGAIDIEPRKDVLDGADGLDAVGREAPAADGQEAEAAFVLAEHPDGVTIIRRNSLLEVGLTGRLEDRDGLRIVLCDWGAAL
jgi:hypothetical protein